MVSNVLDIKPEENGLLTQQNVKSALAQNADTLFREMAWFAAIVNERLDEYFAGMEGDHEKGKRNASERYRRQKQIHVPDLEDDNSVYAEFVKYYKLTPDERLLLMLALVPHIQPHLLDVFFSVNKVTGRGYTEFGGVKGNKHGGFLPTLETALFVIAGEDLEKRFHTAKLFEADHVFMAHGILMPVKETEAGEPFNSNVISLSDEYVDFFTAGKVRKPSFSAAFPAKLLTTGMNWNDLVLDDYAARQLDEIKIWLRHGEVLLNAWGMNARIKPGYKVLFHGPPGTGKSLTAALLGKLFHLDVYRVDLSMVVSKYIGETEKNLEKVFAKAEHKNWILFFDEADALFGKRTGITDANDKYANQEIAYLLQRLEDYAGLVILASNMRNNVDEAFTRRLQSVIYFKKPQARDRLRLWKNSFSALCKLPSDSDLERIAQQYELSGGAIINVVQYASLMALERGDTLIKTEDILAGIKKEFNKEGKTL